MQPPLVVVDRHFQLNLALELTFFSHFKVFFFAANGIKVGRKSFFAFELIFNPYFFIEKQ
jgi:hypothetical protein